MQCEKKKGGVRMPRISKKKKLEILDEVRADEESRIISLLKEDDLYQKSLTPLIENYLDAFVIYKTMYEKWRDAGFPPTKSHQNKAGAINEMKHPLAQQVETWNDKKNKLLDLLGMTNKGKSVQKATNKQPVNATVDELAAHRNKWRKAK